MRNDAAATAGAARRSRALPKACAIGAFAASALFGASGVFIAAHHPLHPLAVAVALCAWMAIQLRFPDAWLLVLPAALPVLNFAPWTGWLILDEFDVAVLGSLAAGWVRLGLEFSAADPQRGTCVKRCSQVGPIAVVLGIVLLVAMLRGWSGSVDARSFDWFDQYVDGANALRVGKSLFFALALWPMLRAAVRRNASGAGTRFGCGMVIGGAFVGFAALWERAAFPGLLDFSNTYRTVALFWEMHVGGAAIDAYLALSTPFVAWALCRARSRAVWTAVAVLALLTGYACLTTFSRGAYVGVGVPIVLLGAVWGWHRLRERSGVAGRVALPIIGTAVAASLLLAGFVVFGFWGVSLVLLALGFVLLALRLRGTMVSWRYAAALALAWALVAEVIAVAGGGTFMRARLNASDSDLATRLAHWERGIGLLESPSDWLLGIGLGRLPTRYAQIGPLAEFSGAVRLQPIDKDRDGVQVFAAPTSSRLSRLYALTQRVRLDTPGSYRVRLLLRVESDTGISLDVCQQHLLYSRECQGALFMVPAGRKGWQQITVDLAGPRLDDAARFVPRLGLLSLSVLPAGASAEFAEINLLAPDGREVLANRDFSSGLAHWFPVAQNYFLPWHIDNLYLEFLIERGVTGLLAFLILAAGAFRGLRRASRSDSSLTPFVAAALCGALVLGSVSSLLDAPRVAFLLWILCFFSLELDVTARQGSKPRSRGVSHSG
jgi:hypothetical protein